MPRPLLHQRPAPIRWLREHPGGADALMAAVVFVVVLGGLLTVSTKDLSDSNRSMDALGVLLGLAQPVLLAFRRRWPVPMLWTSTVLLIPFWVLDYVDPGVSIPVLVLLYSVAAHVPRQRSLPHALAAGGLLVAVMIIGVVVDEEDLPAIAVVGNVIVFGTACVLGDSMSNRRAYLAEVEARAERAESDREAAVERAAQAERTRIARELHDVVAHSVSVMVVQAGAARRVLERHPEQTAESLGIIERTGRDALDELRRVLGVLRAEDPASTAPQPSAGEIHQLVDQWRLSGLDVELRIDGPDVTLSPGVGLTVYRIVQEALTNVRKHAGHAEVTVDIRRRPEAISVVVVDDGRGPQFTDDALPSGGQGIIGMRERVELFGGTLTTGGRPGGGFQVRASIPLVGSASVS